MIVVDENSQVARKIQELDLFNIGVTRIDLPTFEVTNGLVDELILIEDTVYNQLTPLLKDKLSQMYAVIIYQASGAILDSYLNNIVGVVNAETPTQLIENQIVRWEETAKERTIFKSQMITLNQEMNSVMEDLGAEIGRVKLFYEQKIPKRLENFNGLTIYSKYAAGEDMGGEFFDLFSMENKIFILMSSTNSYLASSCILEHFTDLKRKNQINSIYEENFLKLVTNEIKELNKNKKQAIQANVLTCILDISTMELTGHMFGPFQILSSTSKSISENNLVIGQELKKANFSYKLGRGERLLFNSPGFSSSWMNSNPNFIIEEILSNQTYKPLDVLDEVYFQLKKDSLTGFLVKDSSSIILEVQKNVILEV